MTEDWAALETEVINGEFRPPITKGNKVDAKIHKFPCQACGGTGKYRGVRVHQQETKCFACNGQAYFLTSERDRQKARQQRRDSKAKKLYAN